MSFSKQQINFFQKSILLWYAEYGRHFPWRNKSSTNYERIISEVLLQRTKAETVAKFFPNFILKYPSWKQLGNAKEAELQSFLFPLGLYKQRGTRLFKLAQELKKRKGRFPSLRHEVEEFSLMGQYISNAFELFILKHPSPLLDVNMARVLERFFGPRKLIDIRYDSYLQGLAKKVVDHSKSIEINWAILDFGALICIAKKPKCHICIFKHICNYFNKL